MANVQSSLGPSSWMTNQPVNSGARKTNLEILGPIKSPTQPVASKGFGNGTTYGSNTGSTNNNQQAQTNSNLQTENLNLRTAQNQTTQPSTSYGGIIQGLANTQPNQTTTNASGYLQGAAQGPNPAQSNINNLSSIAQNGSPQVQQATQNVKGLQQAQNDIANNPNLAAEVASGRGQALTGQINAGQTALSNALQGQGQQISAGNAAGGMGLTGQSQQIGAASNAGSLGNTAQSNQIGAQGTAGSLSAPHWNGYVGLSPTTGGAIGGGTVNNAINQGGQYDAQYSGAVGNATDNQSIAGAQNNINSLTQLIQNSPELNKSGYNLQNAGYAILQKNMSSSDRATLDNALSSINKALSDVTGTSVDIGQLSTQQGTSLMDTINNQVQLAKGRAAGKLNNGQGGSQSGSSNAYISQSGNKYNLPY